MNPITHYCAERIWSLGHHGPCGNKGKVERDGKWYCGIHDPVAVAVAAKRAKRHEKYQAEAALWREQHDREIAARNKTARRAAAYDELVDALHELAACFSSGDGRVYVIQSRAVFETRLEVARAVLAKVQP